MRNLNFKVALACVLLVAVGACAKRVLVQSVLDPATYQRVAVLPFETQSIISTIGYQLADEIVIELIQNVPDLEVIERTRIDALMLERGLGGRGDSVPSSPVAVGQMLDAQAVMTGSVSFSIEDIVPGPWNKQRTAAGVATVRLIDTRSGRVIWAGREEAQFAIALWDSTKWTSDHEMIQRVIRRLAASIVLHFQPHYERR